MLRTRMIFAALTCAAAAALGSAVVKHENQEKQRQVAFFSAKEVKDSWAKGGVLVGPVFEQTRSDRQRRVDGVFLGDGIGQQTARNPLPLVPVQLHFQGVHGQHGGLLHRQAEIVPDGSEDFTGG